MKVTVQLAIVLAALFLFAAPSAVTASTTIAIDNDLFSGSGHDRDYTGGLRLTFNRSEEIDWQAGLLQFTPDDSANLHKRQEARPFASLLYFGRAKERHLADAIDRTTVSFGLLGLPVATRAQQAIHRVTGSDKLSRDQDQISEGGELTARLGWTRYSTLLDTSAPHRQFNVVTETSISFGYYTSASFGVGFTLSKRPQYWGSSRQHFLAYLDEPFGEISTGWFGGFRIRGVAYNALLQGQFRSSPTKLDRHNVQRLVREAWFGYATNLKGYRISYAIRANSAEYNRGPVQIWGALTITKYATTR